MIIIMGASGFVGRYLVEEALRRNLDIVACGRNQAAKRYYNALGVDLVDVNVADYRSFNKLPKSNVRSIINLAAMIPAASNDDINEDYISVNTIGTFNMLRYALQSGISRFVNTTTRFEVDLLHGRNAIKEDAGRKYRLDGDHAAYVISKVAASDYVDHFTKHHGLLGVNLRLTGLYGAGRYNGYMYQGKFYPYAIEIFIEKATNGHSIDLYENYTMRDNLYVKDAVSAILSVEASERSNGTYNVASGEGVTLYDYAKAICNAFNPSGVKSEIHINVPDLSDKIPDKQSYIFDIKKIFDDFGWSPQYSLTDAMHDYRKELSRDALTF